MQSRQTKKPSTDTSAVSHTSDKGVFEARSFVPQSASLNRDHNHADINQKMRQAKRYGHELNKMQPHENMGQPVIQCVKEKIPRDKKKKVRVDPNTYNNLQMGEEAITYTRNNLPFGAGNQVFDIKKSRGESAARTAAAADMDTPSYPHGNWVQERAANAMKCGAGNCDDMGAVAHSYLGMQNLDQPVNYVAQDDFAHTYSMIGNPRNQNSVVVDPWPRKRQAHLKKHMNPEWQEDLDNSITRNARRKNKTGGLLYTTPAGGEEGFAEKAAEARTNPAISLTDPKAGVKHQLGSQRLTERQRDQYVNDVIYEEGIYSQSSSTKNGNRYRYVLDDTLESPADTESDYSANSDSEWSTDTDEED